MSGVPLHNLYYLLAWAWRFEANAGERAMALEAAELPEHLLAALFVEDVARLKRRGLQRQYREHEEVLRLPRGRLQLGLSVARGQLVVQRVSCELSELEETTLLNGLLRRGLELCLQLRGLPVPTRERAARLWRDMSAIPPVGLEALRRVPDDHRVRGYERPIRILRMMRDGLVPGQDGQALQWLDVRLSEQQMGALFEDFLFNFLAASQAGVTPTREHLRFAAQGMGVQALPLMRTDIVLREGGAGRRHLWEVKYTARPLLARFDDERLRSAHLYQLLAYLYTARAHGRAYASGTLVYAQVGEPLQLDFEIDGHALRVRSVDLNQPWARVEADVLGLARQLVPRPEPGVTENDALLEGPHSGPMARAPIIPTTTPVS